MLTRPPFFCSAAARSCARARHAQHMSKLTMHSLGHACSAAVRCAVTRRLDRQKPFAPLTVDVHIGGHRAAQSGDGDVASAAARGACETAAAAVAAPALAAASAAAKAGQAQPARAMALLLCRSCSATHALMAKALLIAGSTSWRHVQLSPVTSAGEDALCDSTAACCCQALAWCHI